MNFVLVLASKADFTCDDYRMCAIFLLLFYDIKKINLFLFVSFMQLYYRVCMLFLASFFIFCC